MGFFWSRAYGVWPRRWGFQDSSRQDYRRGSDHDCCGAVDSGRDGARERGPEFDVRIEEKHGQCWPFPSCPYSVSPSNFTLSVIMGAPTLATVNGVTGYTVLHKTRSTSIHRSLNLQIY